MSPAQPHSPPGTRSVVQSARQGARFEQQNGFRVARGQGGWGDDEGGAHHEERVAGQGLWTVEAGVQRRQVERRRRDPQGRGRNDIAGRTGAEGHPAHHAQLPDDSQRDPDGERVEMVRQPRQQRPSNVDGRGIGEVVRIGHRHHTGPPGERDDDPTDHRQTHPTQTPIAGNDARSVQHVPTQPEPQRHQQIERQLGRQAPRLGDRPDGPRRPVDVGQRDVREQARHRRQLTGDSRQRCCEHDPVQRIDASGPTHQVAHRLR